MNLLGHLLVGVCVFRIGSAAFNIMFARRRVDPITRLIHLTVYWGNAEFVRLPATAHFEAMNSHELRRCRRTRSTGRSSLHFYLLVSFAALRRHRALELTDRLCGLRRCHRVLLHPARADTVDAVLLGASLPQSTDRPLAHPTRRLQALSSYISRSTLVLLLAQVMGMYFLSSVLLMRMNLPIGYRCERPRAKRCARVS